MIPSQYLARCSRTSNILPVCDLTFRHFITGITRSRSQLALIRKNH